jgi:outer membrane protein
MRKIKITFMAILVVSLLTALPAFAGDFKTSLGLGVGMTPDYEGSDDYEAVLVPFAKVTWESGRYVLLDGNSLRINFLSDNWQFGPVLQYRGKRDNVENDRVDDMEDIDAAIEAGAFLAYKNGPWLFGVDAVTDVSNEHDGYLITLRGAYTAEVSQYFKLTPFLSTTYADDNYMETYFQVDAGNVGTSGLEFRDAEACFKDVTFGLTADYDITDQAIIRIMGAYAMLLDDAKDSPIVDDEGDDKQMYLGLLCIFHF